MLYSASITRSALATVLVLFAAALIAGTAGCREQRVEPERRGASERGADERRADSTPVVGGSCSYERVEFTAIVDSLRPPNRDLIIHAIDSVPFRAGSCHLLRDEGNGRWRILASAAGNLAPGDTALVGGEVIRTGTCTPCSLGVQAVRER